MPWCACLSSYKVSLASSLPLPQVIDIDDCLLEEKSNTEKLSKLFPAAAPFIGPQLPPTAMKKSHSDSELSACRILCVTMMLWYEMLIVTPRYNICHCASYGSQVVESTI